MNPTIATALFVAVGAATSCSSTDSGVGEPVVTSETFVSSSSIPTVTAESSVVPTSSVEAVDEESNAGTDQASTTSPPSSTSTIPPDSDRLETRSEASLSIECTRGDSLNDLGIDITRVPFVDDDAPDDTTWIEIVTTFVNPTDERVAVDPSFEVSFLGSDGEPLATQPWVDGSDPVYGGLEATGFVIGPDQTFTRRVVVFDGFSGNLVLRDNHERLLASLDSCTLSGEPDIATREPDDAPAGVTLEIGACAPTEDGSLFETTLVAENTGDAAVQLVVAVELVDDSGDRVAVVGSNERPVSIEPGATETRSLGGPAWPVENLSTVAGCRIYSVKSPS